MKNDMLNITCQQGGCHDATRCEHRVRAADVGRAGDIVVGVDGSEESFTALQWALREASLSGRAVNAVYAWTHSWDMGAQPDNPDAWEKASKAITEQLLDWVNEASAASHSTG